MPAYLIRYPKGQGEDVLVEDEHLDLKVADGWMLLFDGHGPCVAVPAHAAATITRIDPPEDDQPEE